MKNVKQKLFSFLLTFSILNFLIFGLLNIKISYSNEITSSEINSKNNYIELTDENTVLQIETENVFENQNIYIYITVPINAYLGNLTLEVDWTPENKRDDSNSQFLKEIYLQPPLKNNDDNLTKTYIGEIKNLQPGAGFEVKWLQYFTSSENQELNITTNLFDFKVNDDNFYANVKNENTYEPLTDENTQLSTQINGKGDQVTFTITVDINSSVNGIYIRQTYGNKYLLELDPNSAVPNQDNLTKTYTFTSYIVNGYNYEVVSISYYKTSANWTGILDNFNIGDSGLSFGTQVDYDLVTASEIEFTFNNDYDRDLIEAKIFVPLNVKLQDYTIKAVGSEEIVARNGLSQNTTIENNKKVYTSYIYHFQIDKNVDYEVTNVSYLENSNPNSYVILDYQSSTFGIGGVTLTDDIVYTTVNVFSETLAIVEIYITEANVELTSISYTVNDGTNQTTEKLTITEADRTSSESSDFTSYQKILDLESNHSYEIIEIEYLEDPAPYDGKDKLTKFDFGDSNIFFDTKNYIEPDQVKITQVIDDTNLIVEVETTADSYINSLSFSIILEDGEIIEITENVSQIKTGEGNNVVYVFDLSFIYIFNVEYQINSITYLNNFYNLPIIIDFTTESGKEKVDPESNLTFEIEQEIEAPEP